MGLQVMPLNIEPDVFVPRSRTLTPKTIALSFCLHIVDLLISADMGLTSRTRQPTRDSTSHVPAHFDLHKCTKNIDFFDFPYFSDQPYHSTRTHSLENETLWPA